MASTTAATPRSMEARAEQFRQRQPRRRKLVETVFREPQSHAVEPTDGSAIFATATDVVVPITVDGRTNQVRITVALARSLAADIESATADGRTRTGSNGGVTYRVRSYYGLTVSLKPDGQRETLPTDVLHAPWHSERRVAANLVIAADQSDRLQALQRIDDARAARRVAEEAAMAAEAARIAREDERRLAKEAAKRAADDTRRAVVRRIEAALEAEQAYKTCACSRPFYTVPQHPPSLPAGMLVERTTDPSVWAKLRVLAACAGMVEPIVHVHTSADHKNRPATEILMRDGTSLMRVERGWSSKLVTYRPVTSHALAGMQLADESPTDNHGGPSEACRKHMFVHVIKDGTGHKRSVANACFVDGETVHVCDRPASLADEATLAAYCDFGYEDHELILALGRMSWRPDPDDHEWGGSYSGFAVFRLSAETGGSTLIEASTNNG